MTTTIIGTRVAELGRVHNSLLLSHNRCFRLSIQRQPSACQTSACPTWQARQVLKRMLARCRNALHRRPRLLQCRLRFDATHALLRLFDSPTYMCWPPRSKRTSLLHRPVRHMNFCLTSVPPDYQMLPVVGLLGGVYYPDSRREPAVLMASGPLESGEKLDGV